MRKVILDIDNLHAASYIESDGDRVVCWRDILEEADKANKKLTNVITELYKEAWHD